MCSDVLQNPLTEEVHHGDCIGADFDAHNIAERLGVSTVIHPPVGNSEFRAGCQSDQIRPEQTHLARNRNIVKECKLMLAFPDSSSEAMRSGTWYTIRHAMKEGVPTIVVFPDGTHCTGSEIEAHLRPGKWGN